MKNLWIFTMVTTLSLFGFAADKKQAMPKGGEVKTIELDPASSSVDWIGKKITGQHHGTLNVKSGKVDVKGSELVGGTFEIDMTSLKVLDITDPENNGKLLGHLKSDDFFSIEKFPTATFVIKSVKPQIGKDTTHVISGDLTIKGKTNPIEFPARLKATGAKFEGSASIAVDRTRWDIKYRSGKFFADLGDKVINDNFNLDLKFVTK